MSTILLDTVEKVEVIRDGYSNEIRTLEMLTQGLLTLAKAVEFHEEPHKEFAKNVKSFQYGARNQEERAKLNLIACTFHWFGVSVSNYARLVGFVRGLDQNEFSREDLKTPDGHRKIKEQIKLYLKGVPELEGVIKWRNKVGAHFAITDPHRDDNIATLNMSVMFPVSLDSGIYRVGGWGLMQKNSMGHHISDIPSWSVTEVFAELIPRYWPQFVLGDLTEGNQESGTP